MVAPVFSELTGSHPPVQFIETPWGLSDRIAQRFLDAWSVVCHRITQSGSAEELQACRDDYQATLLGYLKILDGWLVVLSRFWDEQSDGETIDRIASNRDRLQKHYDSLFPRWRTLDDLEALLLERISLPNEKLKELATRYPAPPAWYNEVDDQLTRISPTITLRNEI